QVLDAVTAIKGQRRERHVAQRSKVTNRRTAYGQGGQFHSLQGSQACDFGVLKIEDGQGYPTERAEVDQLTGIVQFQAQRAVATHGQALAMSWPGRFDAFLVHLEQFVLRLRQTFGEDKLL